MRALVIGSAILLALFGLLAWKTSPNPSDHLGGKIIVGIAAGYILLAIYASPKLTAWIYFGSIVLVVAAYSLPMSFWRIVGVADRPAPAQPESPPADDQ